MRSARRDDRCAIDNDIGSHVLLRGCSSVPSAWGNVGMIDTWCVATKRDYPRPVVRQGARDCPAEKSTGTSDRDVKVEGVGISRFHTLIWFVFWFPDRTVPSFL